MSHKSSTKKNRRSEAKQQSFGKSGIASALFSATQQKVLSLLFGQPKRSFFTNEIIELAGNGVGASLRVLKRLVSSKLVTVQQIGNQKHYKANADSPIFVELCGIVYKTLGIPIEIKKALQPIRKKIELAFIYGSVARQEDTAESDIDLLVVADDLLLEKLFLLLSPVESRLKRTINPRVISQAEYSQRRKRKNPFLTRVLSSPTIVLIGEDSDLEGA